MVGVENAEQCQMLLDFLRECSTRLRLLDDRSVALDLDEEDCPALATLVADLEAWRARVRQAVLWFGGETRILRTEG